jgi:valyl-tRNA synthetase
MESKGPPSKSIDVTIVTDVAKATVEAHAPAIATLARARPLTILDSREGGGARRHEAKILLLKGIEVILPLEGMIDFKAERSRLLKEIESNQAEIRRMEHLLADDAFLNKAPAPVIEKERRKLDDRRNKLIRLEERLARLG